jgi:hypothetical protein
MLAAATYRTYSSSIPDELDYDNYHYESIAAAEVG